MSFLNNIGGAGAAAGGFQPSAISSGFGHMIGADPSRVSMIADRIGKAANGIATSTGVSADYNGSARAPQIDNHLQMLDPNILQSIIARFQPTTQGYAR